MYQQTNAQFNRLIISITCLLATIHIKHVKQVMRNSKLFITCNRQIVSQVLNGTKRNN